MKRPTPKKLELARTTIRVLNEHELRPAVGGLPTSNITCSEVPECNLDPR